MKRTGDVGALLARVGGGIFQNAWVVDDLSAAEAGMGQAFGGDDWVEFEMDPAWQVGDETVSSPLACAFARRGNHQIELLQPLGTEGVVATHLARFGPGPHHLGTIVADLDAEVRAATDDGFPPAMTAEIGPLRVAFLDTVDVLGVYLELLEDPDGMLWATKPWRDDPMTIGKHPTTGPGRFTACHPELGTDPVSYEDSISPEFFEAEQEAVFRRTWLYVGREARLPKPGTYFTRELPNLASLVVARDLDGTVHAFHNVCAHRGNKVVWQEHPGDESAGSCRQFQCKYHGWRYGLDGGVAHVTNEEQFFDLDPSTLGMPPIACDVFAGFVFVNLADDPVPLRDFLGDRILELEAYPFEKMTQRYGFATRIHGNWKLAVDSVCEWYHPAYVHAAFIDPDVSKAEKMVPPVDAYHYDVFRPHMLTSVPGPPVLPPREGSAGEPKRDQRWIYRLFRAGLFGPDDVPDIGEPPDFLNRGDIAAWGNDQFWLFPNLSIQIWARNYFITYAYWPESVDAHRYEIDLWFVPPANAHERLAQELVVDSTIEFAMQDVNTIEATHSALATRAQTEFHLSDQELLIRQFHTVVQDTVAAHQAAAGEGAS